MRTIVVFIASIFISTSAFAQQKVWSSFKHSYVTASLLDKDKSPQNTSNDIINKVQQLPLEYVQDKTLAMFGISKLTGMLLTYVTTFVDEIKIVGNPGRSSLFILDQSDTYYTKQEYLVAGIVNQGDECYLPVEFSLERNVNSSSSTLLPSWTPISKHTVLTIAEKNQLSCAGDQFIVVKTPITFDLPGEYRFVFGQHSISSKFVVYDNSVTLSYDFKNATFKTKDGTKYKFTNGEFSDKKNNSFTYITDVRKTALTGKSNEHTVVANECQGNSCWYVIFVTVIDRQGLTVLADLSSYGGDPLIETSSITTFTSEYVPSDSRCCPSYTIHNQWKYVNGEFKIIHNEKKKRK